MSSREEIFYVEFAWKFLAAIQLSTGKGYKGFSPDPEGCRRIGVKLLNLWPMIDPQYLDELSSIKTR